MIVATLAQLRDRVLANLDREDASAAEQARVTDYINELIREDLAQLHNWAFMEHEEDITSVDGQEDYAFPDTGSGELFKDCRFLRFRTTSTEEFRELTEIPVRVLNQNFQTQVEGQPTVFARVGNSFRVRSVPDASTYTFRVSVWEYPAALSADEDTNDFTLYYPRLIEFGATARGFLHYGELQAAGYWSSSFANERDRAIKIDRQRLAPNERTLVPSTAAGRPGVATVRGPRHRTAPFSWWT